jgi:signal transduction histidine kinase
LLVDRLSDGSVSVPTRVFDACSAVHHELERQRVNRPQVEVSVDGDFDACAEVIGSERLFRRAVRNLLSNALRHARSHVRVSITQSSGTILIQIDDDGPGIPASERTRVLEPFVRLDESRSRELGGVGLGLTIVERIVRATGGSLRIGEASSGGASVAISWPCDGGTAGAG